MAAPVRIESAAFSDIRYEHLGSLLGTNRYDALGRMAYLWQHCTEKQTYILKRSFIGAIINPDKLIEADLGEETSEGIRIKGTEGRIEWLNTLRDSAKTGGRNRSISAERDENGRFKNDKHQANTSQMPGKTPGKHQANTSPLTLTLTPTLTIINKDIDTDIREVKKASTESKDSASVVFDYYQVLHPHARLGNKAKIKIRDRYKEKFTDNDLIEAIDGAHKTPWNNGEETGKKYLNLDLILRDANQVQRFIENNRNPPKPQVQLSNRAKILQNSARLFLGEENARQRQADVYEINDRDGKLLPEHTT